MGEACDDGNLDDVDACLSSCLLNPCGNGVMEEGEACDDGERDGGDACSPTCQKTEIAAVSVAGDHTCALFKSGKVRCWGQNEQNELCNGDSEDMGDGPGELPVADIFLPGHVKQIASGGYHTCALLDTSNVHCWGRGANGQLGYANVKTDAICDPEDGVAPKEVPVGKSVLAIAAGGVHTCVLTWDNKVSCWGFSGAGQVGVGVGQYDAPQVLGLEGVSELVTGNQHTCALMQDKKVRCWGFNAYGQLGIGSKTNVIKATDSTPVPMLEDVAHIAAGGHHTCALTSAGDVKCWGANGLGQLGNGLPGDSILDEMDELAMPLVVVDLKAPAKAIALGSAYSCAILVSGDVKCWGDGSFGSLGYGDTKPVRYPGEFAVLPAVDLGGKAEMLSASCGYDEATPGRSTCAILADSSMRCWGRNNYGQLGLGHRNDIGDDEGETPNSAGPVPY